jgi:hypothetical protein
MIEGGTPGGSAQSQAAERRANAERLLSEATRLDATAADERSMAAHLAELPSSYTEPRPPGRLRSCSTV